MVRGRCVCTELSCTSRISLTEAQLTAHVLGRILQAPRPAGAGEDELALFGIFEVEKMTEALKRRYADLHKEHVEQEYA